MSGLAELHLAPAVAAALESFGYSAADQIVRDQAPTAARGHNLVLAWPPSARYAAPALAGLVSAVAAGGKPALLLVPEHALDEWAAVLAPFARAAGLPSLACATPARATRPLRAGQLPFLVTTPSAALALLERSALKPDQLGHVVLVWPEQFEDAEALAAVMQDLSDGAQRILVLADPPTGHAFVERYARRALTVGPLALPQDMTPTRVGSIRLASAAWGAREAAVRSLLESEDPAVATLWCADLDSASAARRALGATDSSVQVVTGDEACSGLIVAWDLPDPARLALLRAAGSPILLVPPHAAAYIGLSCVQPATVRLTGATEQVRLATARQRGKIVRQLEQGGLEGALLTLAPLFERHDPALVAAALYRMWNEGATAASGGNAPDALPATGSNLAARAKVWIGVGKKELVTPADLVGMFTRELGIDASKLGKIEIRETFSLVEVPGDEAEEIARRVNGRTIRRRQVIAKVDRGMPERPARDRAPRTGSRPPARPRR